MIICVEATKSFDDYNVFMRAMGVALNSAKPNGEVNIWVVNSHRLNHFARSFFNITESYLKSHKIKTRVVPVTKQYAALRLGKVDYFAYCCRKREPMSSLAKEAESLSKEVGVFIA